MTAEIKNGCGTKHFKLGCWIIGTMAGVMVLLMSITLTAQASIDDRVRAVETGQAAAQARQADMQRTLERVELKLDKLMDKERLK